MVIDSSVLVALALGESDAAALAWAISDADVVLIGTPTMFEARMVLARRGVRADWLDEMLAPLPVRIIPFTEEHQRAAFDAWQRYGKGRHPAGLNFGDGMAYAVARGEDRPLRYKGGDFAKTDARAAV